MMIESLLSYISEQLPSIFTGLTMSFIGIGVYEFGSGYVYAGGQFRGKYAALILLLGSVSCAALFTPLINSFWTDLLPQLEHGQILGGLLGLGMLAVNEVTGWNHVEAKSGVVYAISVLLIVEPDVLAQFL